MSTRRSAISEMFSREAWRLLDGNYERVLQRPSDLDARGAMLLGAHYAGIAIEHGMLGAAHACANPLTARYGVAHGVAVCLMLSHVVRWNEPAAASRYAELLGLSRLDSTSQPADALARRLDLLATAGCLPRRLSAVGVPETALDRLAEDAAQQWTGRFNPRVFDTAGARGLYEAGY